MLASARGESETAIASELEINRKTVRLWRGVSYKEAYRSCGRSLPDATQSDLRSGPGQGGSRCNLAIEAAGPDALSCRLMAASQGVSKSTVSNLWKSHNIKPHRSKTFKLSRDPKFLEKLTDVVGLYLNPPDQAIVLCVDEKSQIQALNRTQPGLPLKKGRCGTLTHDYKRND